jgi:hypothetical protein
LTNADTEFGIYNKKTREIKIVNISDGSIHTQSFGGDIATAKNCFFTADALDCFNTNATQLAWAITDDGNGIKYTIAFGIHKDTAATSWADAWTKTHQKLLNANNWIKSTSYDAKTQTWLSMTSASHLF